MKDGGHGEVRLPFEKKVGVGGSSGFNVLQIKRPSMHTNKKKCAWQSAVKTRHINTLTHLHQHIHTLELMSSNGHVTYYRGGKCTSNKGLHIYRVINTHLLDDTITHRGQCLDKCIVSHTTLEINIIVSISLK